MLKRRSWLGLALAVPFLPGVVRAQGGGMVVFAAASLKNALDEIAAAWAKDTGKPAPRISYAASSALARQMEQGAPADLFISADLDWMDYAAGKNLIRPDSRFNLLGNKIVLIAPRDSRPRRSPSRRRPRRGAGRRQAVDGQRRCRAGRQVRQGGAGEARRLGSASRTASPRPRTCAPRCCGGARRGAARHRLQHRRRGRARASRSWRPSRRTRIRRSSTRPRSLANRRTPTRGTSSTSCAAPRRAPRSRSRASPSW